MIALFLIAIALIAEAGLGFRNLHRIRRWAVSWNHLRRGCPGPFVRVRSEVVSRLPVHCNSAFWVESQIADVRVRCPQCGRLHQIHARTLVRHEHED